MSLVVPAIPRPLLEYLQRVFPNKLPLTALSPEALGALIGQQALIAHLAMHFERQAAAVIQPT